MALSAFPYVGGKTNLAQWIISKIPQHTVYVEPFGGSAAVLLNKPRSTVEVFNDLDGDVVHFFEVVRERPDELAEWCRRTPFSEELHNRWVRQFYNAERPDDPVERAGRWMFLRYTQFGGKYSGPSGFKRDTPRCEQGASSPWRDAPNRVDAVCERLQGVSIQNADYSEVIDRYDSPETVFYADPPYLGKEDTYRVDEFGHADLAAQLEEIEGYALVSYTDRPDSLYSDWLELSREFGHDAGNRTGHTKEVTERLLCNFNPAKEPDPAWAGQATLGEVSNP